MQVCFFSEPDLFNQRVYPDVLNMCAKGSDEISGFSLITVETVSMGNFMHKRTSKYAASEEDEVNRDLY